MKSIAHAWVALMALERLKRLPKAGSRKTGFMTANLPGLYLGDTFDDYYQAQADRFVTLFDKHKDSFLKGAWFPDSVIADNLVGGHTFKLKKPETDTETKQAVGFANRLPKFMSPVMDMGIKEARLDEKVYRLEDYTLPDRCEALTHTLRDMVLIQMDQPKGSDIMFNDDQLTLYFLMLSHYVADAHVPPHCDDRDFYGPSTIHPDMEGYWDDEVIKYFEFDKPRGVFDYDIDGAPELFDDPAKREAFKGSVLYKALQIVNQRKWPLKNTKSGGFTEAIIGQGNKKIYDLIKAVCFSSYLISTDFIPYSVTESEYKKLKIVKDANYKKRLDEISPYLIANAIDAIALIWLLTWDKYNALKEGIKEKKAGIAKEGEVK
ncbi:MAG: hypothetical protein PHT12_00910 [Patescibacteria group bacterium]|nr:hypothetical protein [Patescibacteria group bacterium]